MLSQTLHPLTLAPVVTRVDAEDDLRPVAARWRLEPPRSGAGDKLDPSIRELLQHASENDGSTDTDTDQYDERASEERGLRWWQFGDVDKGQGPWLGDRPQGQRVRLERIRAALTAQGVGVLMLSWRGDESVDLHRTHAFVRSAVQRTSAGSDLLHFERGGIDTTLLMGLWQHARRLDSKGVGDLDANGNPPPFALPFNETLAWFADLLTLHLRLHRETWGRRVWTLADYEHGFHHTVLRTTQRPDDADLWRTVRAHNPSARGDFGTDSATLAFERSNRALAVAREGVLLCSWPTEGEDAAFESTQYPRKFHSNLGYLSAVAYMERLALDNLSTQVQTEARRVTRAIDQLVSVSASNAAHMHDHQQIVQLAHSASVAAHRLSAALVRTTLSLVIADAGGRTEGARLFERVRHALRSDAVLAEHRAQVLDLLRIVESISDRAKLSAQQAAEIEQRQRDKETEASRQSTAEAQRVRDQVALDEDRAFQRRVGIGGVGFGCAAFLSGVFGMNPFGFEGPLETYGGIGTFLLIVSAGILVVSLAMATSFAFATRARRSGRGSGGTAA
jgi:hypothetical protein